MYTQNHLSNDDPSAKPCRMLQLPDLRLRFARLIMLRRMHSSKAGRAWSNESNASEEGQKQGRVVIVMMVVEEHPCTAFECLSDASGRVWMHGCGWVFLSNPGFDPVIG
jgi:hypothetical protein